MARRRRIPAFSMILAALIVSSALSTPQSTTTSRSSRVDELTQQLEKSTLLLQRTSILLKQERKRWKTIHTNPVPDNITATYEADRSVLTLTVSIDTGIKNEINSEPITRTYTIPVTKPRARVLPQPFTLIAGASYMGQTGLRPLIGIGVIEIPGISKLSAELARVSLFCYTTVYSAGVGCGYLLSEEYRVSVDVLAGTQLPTGILSAGIGISFHL